MTENREDLEVLAIAAYEAFTSSSADLLGEMPRWHDLPPDWRAYWRTVADAARMMARLPRLG